MENKILIFLDDARNPYEHNWLNFSPVNDYSDVVWLKNYNEFVGWIEKNGLPYAICFDHDLEFQHYQHKMDDYEMNQDEYIEKTGYHCAKWLVEYCLDRNLPIPHYNIQSANPVGKENIRTILENYKKYWLTNQQ